MKLVILDSICVMFIYVLLYKQGLLTAGSACVSPEVPSAAPPPPQCSSVVPQGDRQIHFSHR